MRLDVIYTVCAWCGAEIGETPANGAPGGTSHGMCGACLERWEEDAA